MRGSPQKLLVFLLTHPFCKNSRQIDGVISAVSYNLIIKKLIHQFKYKPNLSKLSEVIGELMADFLSQNEAFINFLDKYNPVFIPIPLSAKRFRERGYNHAELISYYVAQYFNRPMDTKMLVRVKDTKPQYKLKKEDRRKNIEGAFKIGENQIVPGSIILIDDIATTYATLKEAARVLKKAGAKRVLGVTFARDI